MRERPRSAKVIGWTAVAAAVTVSGAVALAVGSPDAVLSRSYGRTFATADLSWSAAHAGNIWLSSGPAVAATMAPAVHSGLTVGDRITIAKRGGGHQEIEVTALEQVDGSAADAMRYQVVTGRPLSGGQSVRFIFSVEGAQPIAPEASIPLGRSL